LGADTAGGRSAIASIAKIHDQVTGANEGRRTPVVCVVVVTLRVKVVGAVEPNGWLVGTEQFAPIGAPVQLKEAVPLIPAPPIERV